MPLDAPRRIGAWSACALALLLAPAAQAADFAPSALNIVPSGQHGTVPPPPGADLQARMYDALTPLTDRVTTDALPQYFKSESLDPAVDGPLTTEAVPRPGVTIQRDRYGVPHITGATRDDVVWASGWVTQEDRGLLLQQARYAGRIAAVDVPNLNAFDLVRGLKQFT